MRGDRAACNLGTTPGVISGRMSTREGNPEKPTAAKEHRPRRSRRPSAPQLPFHVRKEIGAFARNLAREHRAVFASDPIYRKRAGQFLTALLPPKPRRRGRPGRQDVTQAIRLLNRSLRHYPDERPAEHWARMYAAVIPGYGDMNSVQRQDAEQRLRERVRWRRRARKRFRLTGKSRPANLRL
jgi:hypothetical protein